MQQKTREESRPWPNGWLLLKVVSSRHLQSFNCFDGCSFWIILLLLQLIRFNSCRLEKNDKQQVRRPWLYSVWSERHGYITASVCISTRDYRHFLYALVLSLYKERRLLTPIRGYYVTDTFESTPFSNNAKIILLLIWASRFTTLFINFCQVVFQICLKAVLFVQLECVIGRRTSACLILLLPSGQKSLITKFRRHYNSTFSLIN